MKLLFNENDINRTLKRMAHEILEKNEGPKHLVLVGIKTRGVYLAHRLSKIIHQFEGIEIPTVDIDIAHWRDDRAENVDKHIIDMELTNKIVVLVDDVLFSGRTIRAAMDGIIEYGRPSKIQCAVLVDRGHRELPIRADIVGKNIPTSPKERVYVKLKEIDQEDGVIIDS